MFHFFGLMYALVKALDVLKYKYAMDLPIQPSNDLGF